jgi:hypothetical protein
MAFEATYPLCGLTPYKDHDRERFHAHIRRIITQSDRQRPPGKVHQDGTCGYMGSLCHTCQKIEDEAFTHAFASWRYPILPPRTGMSTQEYARVLGIPMRDGWYKAAMDLMRRHKEGLVS